MRFGDGELRPSDALGRQHQRGAAEETELQQVATTEFHDRTPPRRNSGFHMADTLSASPDSRGALRRNRRFMRAVAAVKQISTAFMCEDAMKTTVPEGAAVAQPAARSSDRGDQQHGRGEEEHEARPQR